MTTLQLLLPDDLSRFLNSLGKDKEAFVLDAIKSKLSNWTKRMPYIKKE